MDWHGWGIVGGDALCIGPLPGRKSICLFKQTETTITPLAYFRDEESAREALELLDTMIGRL